MLLLADVTVDGRTDLICNQKHNTAGSNPAISSKEKSMNLFNLKNVEFTPGYDGDLSQLKCPCGSDCIHSIESELFNRHEDKDIGIHVVANNAKVTIDNMIEKNLSPRRQSIVITFWCEWCDCHNKLAIIH